MNTITIDKAFLSMAITTVLQLRGEISDMEFIEVSEWEIDNDNETIELLVDLGTETSN